MFDALAIFALGSLALVTAACIVFLAAANAAARSGAPFAIQFRFGRIAYSVEQLDHKVGPEPDRIHGDSDAQRQRNCPQASGPISDGGRAGPCPVGARMRE